MSNKLWYYKYRPNIIEDYVWNNAELKSNIEYWIEHVEELPHLIFHGSSGTGKTTLALLLKSYLIDDDSNFLQVNASVNSGVDYIKNTIIPFCDAAGWGSIKIILFDEAERLTKDSQEMLRGIMDKYGADKVKFIFTCNNINKIILPLQGRCISVELTSLDKDMFIDRLIQICEQEQLELNEEIANVIEKIVKENYPNLRLCISKLQKLCRNTNIISIDEQSNNEITDKIFEYLLGNYRIQSLRMDIADFDSNDIEDFYKHLYENSSKFEKKEEDIIPIIAEYLYRHQSVTFSDINFIACLIIVKRLISGSKI